MFEISKKLYYICVSLFTEFYGKRNHYLCTITLTTQYTVRLLNNQTLEVHNFIVN